MINTTDKLSCIKNINSAVVIGGVNMDICAVSAEKPVMRDSNPGRISVNPGGVGRNIAHNLSLLGADVALIAAVGDDFYSRSLKESCAALGIDTSMIKTVTGMGASTYLYVTDETGDMLVAVNDMDIVKAITPEYLSRHLDTINSAAAVVIDANLSPEAIAFIAANCTAPIYADPVSTIKGVKLEGIMDRLWCIKPNMMEAQALTGENTPEGAAAAFLARGVKHVFISMGSEGIYAADMSGAVMVPCPETETVNTTGAGDAVTAAIVRALMRGYDIESAAAYGVKAGAMTSACNETNNPDLVNIRI